MGVKHYHLDVSIKYLLEKSAAELGEMFKNPNGEYLSGFDARQYLIDHLKSGVVVLPLSEPLSEPCDGWSDVTGCPGHEVENLTIDGITFSLLS